jgi:hypothetical protein
MADASRHVICLHRPPTDLLNGAHNLVEPESAADADALRAPISQGSIPREKKVNYHLVTPLTLVKAEWNPWLEAARGISLSMACKREPSYGTGSAG